MKSEEIKRSAVFLHGAKRYPVHQPLVIILNAPPSSGKTVAQKFIHENYAAEKISFKTKLVELVLCVYSIPKHIWNNWYTTEGKELPRPELHGRSCRQALIHMSEEVIKPAFGKEYFGTSVGTFILDDMSEFTESLYISDDGGFNEEVEALAKVIGGENIHIIQIYREGYDYSNDSRNYIDTEVVPEENYTLVYNNGTEKEFLQEIKSVVDLITSVHSITL